MYDQITLLYPWNLDNIINQLYFNKKEKKNWRSLVCENIG